MSLQALKIVEEEFLASDGDGTAWMQRFLERLENRIKERIETECIEIEETETAGESE